MNKLEVNFPVDLSSFDESLLKSSYTDIRVALNKKRMRCKVEEIFDCMETFYCYKLYRCIEFADHEDEYIVEPDTWIAAYCDKDGNLIMPFMIQDSEKFKKLECKLLEQKFVYVGGYKFQKKGDGVELIGYKGSEEIVTVPKNINGLPVKSLYKTFYHNDKIKQVIIPDGDIAIGYFTFCGCSNLQKIEVSKETKLNKNAFEYCDALIKIRK